MLLLTHILIPMQVKVISVRKRCHKEKDFDKQFFAVEFK